MEQKYTAYFKGKLRRGHDKDYVCVALSAKLNLSNKKIESLFKKKKVKIKSNLSKKNALRMARKFYHCGMVLLVSKSEVTVIKGKGSELVEKIEAHNYEETFAGQCPKADFSIGYKFGLILCLLITLLIPLIYFSLLGLVIYGLYEYFTVFLPETIKVAKGVYYHIILKTFPPLLGFLLLMFLLKPLFATYKKQPKLLLKNSENPEFFELIAGISSYVGISNPSLVYVNNDTRTSASFCGGVAGFFKGKMMLIVGMPLVNSLSSQQLSGVISQELGHFAQRGVMRISVLISLINAWLYSRAFKDDVWDEKIKYMRKDSKVSVCQVFLGLMLVGVSQVRYLMKLLFAMSIKVSSYLSREMEFDADRYEATVAGSHVFKETSLRLRLLNKAQIEAVEINDNAYGRSSELFEDMPSAVAKISEEFDAKDISGVEEGMDEVHLHAWDSHPADNERIKYVESLQRKGLFLSTTPAKAFFSNLSELNREVTYRYYDKYLCILKPKDYMVKNTSIKG